MADLMGSITTEFRIAGRILRETALGLKRTGWMNVVIVITMASILSIFGVLLAVVLETRVLLANVGSQLEISAYLKDGANPKAVQEQILQLPHIKEITLISKEKAWAEMQKETAMPDIENPLPNTIHIQLDKETYIPGTVEKLKTLTQIEEVQYAKGVLSKIRAITQGASIVGMVFISFLGLLTLFVISNTIHLLIQAKSREIEILRMMGVGNWYIRLPFLMQGALYGLSGALISYIPLSMAVYYLNLFFNFIGFNIPGLAPGDVLSFLVLMGLFVGGSGSAIAIRKYLHV